MRKSGSGVAADQTNAMLATSKEVISLHRTPALRQPISYDDSKRLYEGETIRLRNVETDTKIFENCEVRYDRKNESLTLRNLTPRQERTRPIKPQRKSSMKPKF